MNETVVQIATVIDRTNQFEVQINLALSDCIVPASAEYGFLRETLFHNLCLGFGAKVRLLQRILDYWDWKDVKLDSLHKLMQLRNAFAHTPTTKRVLLVGVDPDTGNTSRWEANWLSTENTRHTGKKWNVLKHTRNFKTRTKHASSS